MPPLARLPTSSSRPPAPWSVPRESLSSGRRPNSLQISVSTRSERPRASRSACQASSESPRSWSRSACAWAWASCVSKPPLRDRRRRACRSPRRAGGRGCRAPCRGRCPGYGSGRRGRLVLLGQRRQAVVGLDRVAVHRAHGGQARMLGAGAREPAVGRQEGLLVPHVRDVEAEVARARRRVATGARWLISDGSWPQPTWMPCSGLSLRADHVERAARASRCGRGAGPTMPLRQ